MTQSPSEYLFNKTKQEQTPFIINNQGGFYLCKNELIPMHEFNAAFPLAEKIRVLHMGQQKGDNIGSAAL